MYDFSRPSLRSVLDRFYRLLSGKSTSSSNPLLNILFMFGDKREVVTRCLSLLLCYGKTHFRNVRDFKVVNIDYSTLVLEIYGTHSIMRVEYNQDNNSVRILFYKPETYRREYGKTRTTEATVRGEEEEKGREEEEVVLEDRVGEGVEEGESVEE